MTAEITQAGDGFVTPADYANVDKFLTDCGVSPDRPGFDRAMYEDFRQTLAIYGAALTRAVRTQARDAALEEAASELVAYCKRVREAGKDTRFRDAHAAIRAIKSNTTKEEGR